jgi:hypothetical protein
MLFLRFGFAQPHDCTTLNIHFQTFLDNKVCVVLIWLILLLDNFIAL